MKVPFYWIKHLKEKINQIKERQKSYGDNCFTFAVVSDIHWASSAKNLHCILKPIMDECNISHFVNLGDVVIGLPFCEKKDLIDEMKEYRKALKDINKKCIIVEGNHDRAFSPLCDENAYFKNITKKELVKHLFKNAEKNGENTYYYTDDVKNKVRYVVLDTHDLPEIYIENNVPKFNSFSHFVIRQKQLEWIAKKALNLPNETWSVVICSHENANAKNPKHLTQCNELLLGVFNAFISGGKFCGCHNDEKHPEFDVKIDVDFNGKRGRLIAWLGGHDHQDMFSVVDNIPCVTITDDSCGVCDTERTHYLGSAMEHSIDVYVVDKTKRCVCIIRVGAGDDRAFEY